MLRLGGAWLRRCLSSDAAGAAQAAWRPLTARLETRMEQAEGRYGQLSERLLNADENMSAAERAAIGKEIASLEDGVRCWEEVQRLRRVRSLFFFFLFSNLLCL